MRCQSSKHPDRSYDALVGILYRASIDPSQWQVFLDRISADCGRIPVHLFGHDDQSGTCIDLLQSGYDTGYIDEFRDYYGAINTWAPGFFRLPVGKAHAIQRMCPERELLKTEFYADWVKPQDDIRKGGGVMLYRDDTRMFALGANIRSRDEKHLVDPWLQLIERLTPHLQQSLEISRRIAGLTLEKFAMAQTDATVSNAVLAIDRQARLLFANDRAQSLLDAGEWVRQDIGGAVRFTDPENATRLDTLLRRRNATGTRHPIAFTTRSRDGRPIRCHGAFIQSDVLGSSPLGLLVHADDDLLLLTLSRPNEPELAELLRSRYGLTAREAAVALAVADGQSLQQIATESQRSVHTIRDQQKAAMRKLGVSRQAQLAVMLERIARPLG